MSLLCNSRKSSNTGNHFAYFILPGLIPSLMLQVSVWGNNYQMACVDGPPSEEMMQLKEWLSENTPTKPHPTSMLSYEYIYGLR